MLSLSRETERSLFTPDPKGDPEEGEDGVRQGIFEGEMTTDGPSLTTVAGAIAAFFLAESFLNKGLHRKSKNCYKFSRGY